MIRRPLRDRFEEKYEVAESGCWLWTAATTAPGYAKIGVGDGTWDRGHRVAYRLFVGPIPDDCEIHHTCGVKRCVNPAHLRALTRLDHRQVTPHPLKTHCLRGHELDGENLYLFRGTIRHCRTCRRDKAREAWRVKNGFYNR